jgi:hypothetical protein
MCTAVVLLNDLAFNSHMLYKSVTVSVFGIPTTTSSLKRPDNELQTEKKPLNRRGGLLEHVAATTVCTVPTDHHVS